MAPVMMRQAAPHSRGEGRGQQCAADVDELRLAVWQMYNDAERGRSAAFSWSIESSHLLSLESSVILQAIVTGVPPPSVPQVSSCISYWIWPADIYDPLLEALQVASTVIVLVIRAHIPARRSGRHWSAHLAQARFIHCDCGVRDPGCDVRWRPNLLWPLE
jgi:hypothetical protein